MGRDHTLYATVPGYVRFYKEKWMRGERKFVGVVLNRGEKLPRDEEALGRSRFFGLVNLNASMTDISPSPSPSHA
jgi:large subunit ribosomal protein L27